MSTPVKISKKQDDNKLKDIYLHLYNLFLYAIKVTLRQQEPIMIDPWIIYAVEVTFFEFHMYRYMLMILQKYKFGTNVRRSLK